MSDKITLLSTIALDGPLIDKAKKRGMELDALSFIRVNYATADMEPELMELRDLPITAVFTSANAVNAIADIVLLSEAAWNIYCIGNATKNAVMESFSETAIKGMANSAAELAEVILADNVLEVVFFCGDKRMDILPDLLRADEVSVHEMVVYETIETPHVVEKSYSGILFFSPSGASSFFSVNTPGSTCVLFAIGGSTAEAIKKYSANKIVLSETPSKENVVDDAINYFHA